jgi:hypothetical protein
MAHYPLLFGFRDLVAGKGFLAGVSINGRALLLHDPEDGYWMYGVNPGGLAAGGADVGEAQHAFRETYRTILFDIAMDAEDFEAFRLEVSRFFEESNEELVSEWRAAVEEVRSGEVKADWLPQADAKKARLSVEVSLLAADQLKPSLNEPDEEPALAAAAGF